MSCFRLYKNSVTQKEKNCCDTTLYQSRGPPQMLIRVICYLTYRGGVSMPLVCYVSERDINTPLDAERLLSLLGVSGKLSGFYFAVYMIEQVRQKPDHILLVTKRLYKQTARHFGTTSSCVERNLRTLVQACWRQPDHSLLECVAGSSLTQPPTNTQFIDMLSAYLRE